MDHRLTEYKMTKFLGGKKKRERESKKNVKYSRSRTRQRVLSLHSKSTVHTGKNRYTGFTSLKTAALQKTRLEDERQTRLEENVYKSNSQQRISV